MIYKVSYVVVGGKKKYPGGVMNQAERPKIGQQVQLGATTFEVIEVTSVMPPNDDFEFLHATVKPVGEEESEA
jgi:hypothetical protein